MPPDKLWWIGNAGLTAAAAAAAALLVRRSTMLAGFLLGVLAWSTQSLAYLVDVAIDSEPGAGWWVDLLSTVVSLGAGVTIALGLLRGTVSAGTGKQVAWPPAAATLLAAVIGWLSTQGEAMTRVVPLRLLAVAVFAGVALLASLRRPGSLGPATLSGLAAAGLFVAVFWSAIPEQTFYSGPVLAGLFVSTAAMVALAGVLALRRPSTPPTPSVDLGQMPAS